MQNALKPGGGCNVERRRQQGEQDIDVPPGDIQSNLDSRQNFQQLICSSGLASEQMSECRRPKVRTRTLGGHFVVTDRSRLWIGCGLRLDTDMDWPCARTIRSNGQVEDMIAGWSRVRTLRGHGQTTVVIVGWTQARTDNSAAADGTRLRTVRRNRLGRCLDASRILPG